MDQLKTRINVNLVEHEISQSLLFSHLPSFDLIEYNGRLSNQVRFYDTLREGKEFHLISLNVIRNEDRLLWESFKDLMNRSIQNAALKMRGIYQLDLLAFDLNEGIEIFNWDEFSQLLINHSRHLKCGGKRLIRYCSIFGVLIKKLDVEWGKVDFHSGVEMYSKEPSKFDLFIKKLLRLSANLKKSILIAIYDVSRQSIIDRDNSEQTQRLKKLFHQQINDSECVVPEIFYVHQNCALNLEQEYK